MNQIIEARVIDWSNLAKDKNFLSPYNETGS